MARPKGKIEYKTVGLQIDNIFLKKTDRTVKELNKQGLKSNRSEVIEAILDDFLLSVGTTAATTEKIKELVIESRIRHVDKRGGDFTSGKKNGTGYVSQHSPHHRHAAKTHTGVIAK